MGKVSWSRWRINATKRPIQVKRWVESLLYEFGTVTVTGKAMPCRKNRITGAVSFILWKKGEQGHNKDYWINMDSYWWSKFEKDENAK